MEAMVLYALVFAEKPNFKMLSPENLNFHFICFIKSGGGSF